MKKNIFKLLLGLAVVIRLILSATTYHQDTGAFALSGKYIAGEGKWFIRSSVSR